MSRLTSLKEAIFGIPKEVPIDVGVAVVSGIDQRYGKRPEITFTQLVQAFEDHDWVQTALRNISSEICGSGFNVEYNKDYSLKINNKSAVDYINYFNKKNDLDTLLSLWSIELPAYGNSFMNITNNEGLTPIPIKSIETAIAIDDKTPIYERYNLRTTGTYNKIIIKDFIHFKVNMDSSSMPFGRGGISPLMTSSSSDVPTLLELKDRIRKVMAIGFERSGYSNELWVLPKASKENLEDIGDKIKKMSWYGNRVPTNADGANIQTSKIERSKDYDQWLSAVTDDMIMCLGDPMVKATIAGNFSEASIRGVIAQHKNMIKKYQREIKRQIENVWDKVLKEALYDPEQAQLRLVFNEDIDTNVDQSKVVKQ